MVKITVTIQEEESGVAGVTINTDLQDATPTERYAGGLTRLVLMQLDQMIEGVVDGGTSAGPTK